MLIHKVNTILVKWPIYDINYECIRDVTGEFIMLSGINSIGDVMENVVLQRLEI